MNVGDFTGLTETVHIPFNTFSSNDPSASVTVTDLVAGDIKIHKDGSTTERSSASGVTVSVDFDGITGNHMIHIDLSDNTDVGYYATGSRYTVRVEGVTVDAGTLNSWTGAFSIGIMLAAVTAALGNGSTLTEAGGTGDQLTAINLPNQTMDIIGDITGNLSGTVGSVTGAVGSVTGAVGSVTGAVGSVAGNVDGTVASVVGAVGSVTGAVGSVTGAVGSVSGNVDGSVASVTGAVGSVTGAVGSVTGAVGSVAGNVDGNVTGSVASVVDSTAQTGDNYARLGGPAGASVSADIAAAQVDLDTLTDARGEPAQGAPPVSASTNLKIDHIYKRMRNKQDSDGTTEQYYNDDTTTVDSKRTVSAAGGTVTKAEIVTGP